MKKVIRTAAKVLALVALSSALSAHAWPVRPIKIIVGLPPGSAPDVAARIIAEKLPEKLSVPVVIVNQPGAGGVNAVRSMQSAKDDHSFLFTITSMTALTPYLLKAAKYDIQKDFKPVVGVAYTPLHVVTGQNSNIKSLNDLIRAAQAKPGAVVFGHPGYTTLGGLAVEMLSQQANVKFNSVQFGNPAQVLGGLMSGEIAAYVDGVSVMLPFSKAGKVYDLALLASTRPPELPNMRLGMDQVKDFVVVGNFGIVAQKELADADATKFELAVLSILNDKDVGEKMSNLGIFPSGLSKENFNQALARENQKWGTVIQKAGLQPQ